MSADARRWILVTGANRGIGRAIAEKLAAEGYGVIAHGRDDPTKLMPVIEAITIAGGVVRPLCFDVADRAEAAAALADEIATHGAPYGVVCNAGITRDGTFAGMSGEAWDAVLGTNLDGFYNVVQPLLLPLIRRRDGGRVIVMTSVAGQIGNRGQVNYSAAKAGLIGAAKALALELASRGITVNCVAPGLIETDMAAEAPQEELLKLIPAGRIGRADEVAGLVAYLCSDAAAYITRQVIGINGGLC